MRKGFKKVSILVASLALVCPLFLGNISNINANASRRHDTHYSRIIKRHHSKRGGIVIYKYHKANRKTHKRGGIIIFKYHKDAKSVRHNHKKQPLIIFNHKHASIASWYSNNHNRIPAKYGSYSNYIRGSKDEALNSKYSVISRQGSKNKTYKYGWIITNATSQKGAKQLLAKHNTMIDNYFKAGNARHALNIWNSGTNYLKNHKGQYIKYNHYNHKWSHAYNPMI